MKRKNDYIKTFKYHFTPVMSVLAVAILCLCGLGIALSVYRIVQNPPHGFSDYLKSPLLIAISAFCIVVVVSVLMKSQYVVTTEYYILQFGFIKNKYPVKEITSLELDTDTQKMTIYMGESFLVLSLCATENEEFVTAIRKVNPNADFSFTLSTPKKQK